ncbi:Hypothetical protein FKW44_012232, partial [Caligus rogercresseyi]
MDNGIVILTKDVYEYTKTNFSTELIFMQEEFKHPRRRKEDCILLQTLCCGKESLRSSMSDVELQ